MTRIVKLCIWSFGILSFLLGCSESVSPLTFPTQEVELSGSIDENIETCTNNPRATQQDLNECASQHALESQQELELLLEDIEKNFSSEDWEQLNLNQIDWENQKEKDCTWSQKLWAGGSIESMKYWECVIVLNNQRIKFLKVTVCFSGRWADGLEACD